MKQSSIVYWLVSLVAVLILVSGPAIAHQDFLEKMGVALPKREKFAPDFSLKNLDGDTVTL